MKLALGTVQFGLDYGVANLTGRPAEQDVAQILIDAAAVGIRVLDTAHLYGESESVLGRCLPSEHEFRVVTKTPKFGSRTDSPALSQELRNAFSRSCERLRCKQVYGLLVHEANDLLSPEGETLWETMVELRDAGLINRIGASVYSGAQIDALLQRYPIELIQLPLSIVDQRLIQSGNLARLAALGVEIHARSIFLQGALLMDTNSLPPNLAPLADHLTHLRQAAKNCGLSMTQAALRFVVNLPEVSSVVCGVDNRAQLQELITAIKLPTNVLALENPSRWAINNDLLLDPSKWNSQ